MKKNIPGFTLVETIIAIGLFMLVLVSVLSVSGNILIATRSQNLDITAQYLLQEGVEYVRNNRDSAINSGASWSDFTNAGGGACPLTIGVGVVSLCPCISTGLTSCSVDPIFNKVQVFGASNHPNIVKAVNSGRTIYCTRVGSGTVCPGSGVITEETTFKRSVLLTQNTSNPKEMYVDVTVSWTDNNGVPRTKSIKTTLFDW